MALTRLGPNQAVNLATNVTGTLATGNGGTGATSFAPGKVGQVVVTETTGNISTTSTSLAATGFIASITPSATTSKVLVFIAGGKLTNGPGTGRIDAHIYSQTGGGGYSDLFKFVDDNNQAGDTFGQTVSGAELHTTNTTSQVDYQVYIKVNSGTVYLNNDSQLTITMMEILA